ncbi:MAG: prolyl-tRNA synthetase associated domain-containing protein [Planktomarina sp.]|nr:prolyl-tRNA synthetase associated domain-containing protein [Planktomarina sp.]
MDASSKFQDSLPISSDALLRQLDSWKILYKRYDHDPLRTVEEAKRIQDKFLPAYENNGYIKNLYLRDKKKRSVLLVAEQDAKIDLKALTKTIGFSNLSFGSPERLMQNLGVRAGAVTPLSMITGVHNNVSLFLDSNLKTCSKIFVHPLVNDRTLEITMVDLKKFLRLVGTTFNWIDI